MVKSISWVLGYGYDLHLLVGDATGEMKDNIIIMYDDDYYSGNDPDIPDSINISFKGLFKGAPNAHGVTINAITGEITIADVLPMPRLYNFIFQALASDDEGNTKFIEMRVHIHQFIKMIWLTPSSLTLYPADETNTRFSVYAAFDDEVYGDITDYGLLGFHFPARLHYSSSNESNVKVDPFGYLSATTPLVSAEITVTYGAAPAPDHLKFTGVVNTKMPLSHPRKIKRINPIGKVEFDKKTNILLIQDGFDDKNKFNKIVSEIVKGLQTDPYLNPFNKLKDDMNYWRLDDADFLGSVEKGSSILGEWYDKQNGRYEKLPSSEKPLIDSDVWNTGELAYMVGLPVQANKVFDFEQQKEIWKQLYDGVDETKITDIVWGYWLKEYTTRKLINERDTPLGIVVYGDYQKISTDNTLIHFNDNRRISWEEFKALIDNLEYDGQSVGSTWTTGKDKGCICLLCRNEIGRESYTEESFFTLILGSGSGVLTKPATGNKRGVDLIPRSLTNSMNQLRPLDPTVIPVFAHECGHAFGLGDEYGEFTGTLPSTFEDPTGGAGNLMPHVIYLTKGDPERFDASAIRWNWYRIKAVGILTKEPNDLTAEKWAVSLEQGHVANFNIGDIIRFRKRNFSENDPFPYSKARFKITNIPNPNPDNKIEITQLEAAFFDNMEFPAGSLFVKTIQGKPTIPDTLGEDLKMIAPIIQTHLEKGVIPLNVVVPIPPNELQPCTSRPDFRSVMVPRNLPDGLPAKMKNKEFNIVGLYEGGRRYYCGVYHPAGLCQMRFQINDKNATRFCQVCRYLIADRVNPLKHQSIDDEYESLYPDS